MFNPNTAKLFTFQYCIKEVYFSVIARSINGLNEDVSWEEWGTYSR